MQIILLREDIEKIVKSRFSSAKTIKFNNKNPKITIDVPDSSEKVIEEKKEEIIFDKNELESKKGLMLSGNVADRDRFLPRF